MMQKKISLKQCSPSPENIVALQQLSSLTFIQSFAVYNTPEDMWAYLTTSLSYKNLEAECDDPKSFFFLATYSNEVIGYIKINIRPINDSPADSRGLEIERIYILQSYQGNSFGQQMIDHIMEYTSSKELKYMWLGVWEKNIKAIKFYKRNGFIIVGSHDFLLGNDKQIDLLMRKDL